MHDLIVTAAPASTPAAPSRPGAGGDFASRLLLAETGLSETPLSEIDALYAGTVAGGAPFKGQPPIGLMPHGPNGGTRASPSADVVVPMPVVGQGARASGVDGMIGDEGLVVSPPERVPLDGALPPWGTPGETAPGIDGGGLGGDDPVAAERDTEAVYGAGLTALIPPFLMAQRRTDTGRQPNEPTGTGTSGAGGGGTRMSETSPPSAGAVGIGASGTGVSATNATGSTDASRVPTMPAAPPGIQQRVGPGRPGLDASAGQSASFTVVPAQPVMSDPLAGPASNDAQPESNDAQPAQVGAAAGDQALAAGERPGARQARGTPAMADPSSRIGITARAMPNPSVTVQPPINAETTAMILGQEANRTGGVSTDPIASMPETAEPEPTLEPTRHPLGQDGDDPGPRDHAAQGGDSGAGPRLPQITPDAPGLSAIAGKSAQSIDAPDGEAPILDAPVGEPAPVGAAPTGAAPTAVSAAEPARGPDAPAPARLADQIAPAIIRLDADATGNQRLTIRLDPVELGQLEIRIERSADATRVNVLVERPETLALLRRDQPALERALDQAGMSSEQRDIVLQLVPAEARPTPDPRPSSQPPPDVAAQMGDPGGNNHGANNPAGDDPGRPPRHAMGRGHPGGSASEPGTDPGQRLPGSRPPDWRRMGIDITA